MNHPSVRPLMLVLLAAAGTFALTMGARQSMGLFVGSINTHTGLGLGAVRVAFSAALAGVVVAFAARTGALGTAGLACSGADGRVTAFFRAGAGVGGLSIAAFVAGAFMRLRLAAWVLMG